MRPSRSLSVQMRGWCVVLGIFWSIAILPIAYCAATNHGIELMSLFGLAALASWPIIKKIAELERRLSQIRDTYYAKPGWGDDLPA
jgi:hypothetical protein